MKCILVFDHLNDVIYTKYNKKFARHINQFAKSQKLLADDSLDTKLLANVIVQIFSPIVTSQRIMSCQFGNSYTSIQCQDGLNMTFEDYMGYLFVCVGLDDVPTMKRHLNTTVALVRYLCGPNVRMLKANAACASLLSRLLDSWQHLQATDQAICVEAVEQLMLNADTSQTALGALAEAIERLRCQTDLNKSHALMFVENKFVSLYSSQNASELGPVDLLFLTLLAHTTTTQTPQQRKGQGHQDEGQNQGNSRDEGQSQGDGQSQIDESDDDDDSEEFYSPSSSPTATGGAVHHSVASLFEQDALDICSHQLLMTGAGYEPQCIPYAVHLKQLSTDGANMHLVILLETHAHASALYAAFACIHTLQIVQIQRQVETLQPAFEALDAALRKLNDALKRSKNNAIETCHRQLAKIWEQGMRKKYLEFMKTRSMEALLRAESQTPSLLDCLHEVLSLTAFDQTVLKSSQQCVNDIALAVRDKMASYSEFLKVKALRNFTLGSSGNVSSLTINKYLEEFPGLVHFIYVDRSSHRVTAPSLDFSSDATTALTRRKIWAMISFARAHLAEGHLSLMWKDVTFNYSYFVWFEDISGAPLKPIVFPTHASKALPQTGIMCGDFYRKLKELCFPKMSPQKVRCYELFCIHLGLATASCVLEHTRRLAATIWELRGHPNHPMDLL